MHALATSPTSPAGRQQQPLQVPACGPLPTAACCQHQRTLGQQPPAPLEGLWPLLTWCRHVRLQPQPELLALLPDHAQLQLQPELPALQLPASGCQAASDCPAPFRAGPGRKTMSHQSPGGSLPALAWPPLWTHPSVRAARQGWMQQRCPAAAAQAPASGGPVVLPAWPLQTRQRQ